MEQLERDIAEALSDPAFFDEAEWVRIWENIEIQLDNHKPQID